MATSVLAWRIPGTGEPGGLLSMGSHRVGHDWSDLAAAVVSHNVDIPQSFFNWILDIVNFTPLDADYFCNWARAHVSMTQKAKFWQQVFTAKKSRDNFANKGPSSQGYGFSGGHVWMWELDCEEGWALKNWCFWTVVLKKIEEPKADIVKLFKTLNQWIN